MALRWAVRSVAKAGTIAIIGVYPPEHDSFPIGEAIQKNLTIKMGNCNHRRYIPELVGMVRSGKVDPSRVLTQLEGATSAVEAYEAFDQRRPGWMKVELGAHGVGGRAAPRVRARGAGTRSPGSGS